MYLDTWFFCLRLLLMRPAPPTTEPLTQGYGSFVFSRQEKCFSYFTAILIVGANGVPFDVCCQWRLTMMMAAYE
jgi:hypothetical protein